MSELKKGRHIQDLIDKALEPALSKLIKQFSSHTEKAYGVVVGAEITWLFSRKEDDNEKAKDPTKK